MYDEAPRTTDWTDYTTGFNHVHSVAVTLDTSKSADWIADEALVAGNTARSHLERLVEMHVIQTVPGEHADRYLLTARESRRSRRA